MPTATLELHMHMAAHRMHWEHLFTLGLLKTIKGRPPLSLIEQVASTASKNTFGSRLITAEQFCRNCFTGRLFCRPANQTVHSFPCTPSLHALQESMLDDEFSKHQQARALQPQHSDCSVQSQQ